MHQLLKLKNRNNDREWATAPAFLNNRNKNMKNMMKKTLLSALAITAFGASFAEARTADAIIGMGLSAEETGLELVKEMDERDLGFGNMEVALTMQLATASGRGTTREMRNKTFEMQDTSVGDKSMIIFDKPRDVKGTAFLTHSNILTADNQWLYLPALKRVKRISSKNKSGPFMGSEFAYEDISSPEVGKYSYKFLGEEKCDNGMDCMKIERYPAYKHSGYTREIMWADKAEFRIFKIDSYDRKSELLKTLTSSEYNQYLGKYWRANSLEMKNHQNGKSTLLTYSGYNFGTDLKETDFTKSVLKRQK
jgi:outer membrane lipoprotein-sorting protein